MLAEVTRAKKLVAVCGSHGKTTTTAMLITALRHAGFPAGYVAGGLFNDSTPPAGVGSNEWVVAEVDESDGTIDGFSPEITVIVNLDWDHPGPLPQPVRAGGGLCRTVRPNEGHDPGQRRVPGLAAARPVGRHLRAEAETSRAPSRSEKEGADEAASRRAVQADRGGRWHHRRLQRRKCDGGAGRRADDGSRSPRRGHSPAIPGVRRRQAVLLSEGGLTVIEDYAHHPAEIRALLPSLRRRVAPGGRLIAVFQPHRHSRTARFKAEFAASLALADAGASARRVLGRGGARSPAARRPTCTPSSRGVRPRSRSATCPATDSGCIPALLKEARPGDLVAFVGAGDIEQTARAWVEAVRRGGALAQRWDRFAETGPPAAVPRHGR